MWKSLLLSCIFVILLAGCGDSGIMNITKLPVSDETVLGIAGNVKDASVQKEIVVHQTLQKRDAMYAKMYKESGFSVEFELVEVSPGMKVQVMKKVQFREAPKFDSHLLTAPSEHPMWGVLKSTIKDAKEGFMFYTGIQALDSILGKSLDSAQPKYYGDYNPQTAAPYVVYPEIVTVP